MILHCALLLIGLTILLLGADFLVKGSASISKKAGIPPIVIGLTVVAFGTSAPEFIVNIFSAVKGTTDLALGNIIGSNIANILLILGVSSLIVNLKVQKNTTWKEIPFAALAVIIVLFTANDKILNGETVNALSRTDGLVLISFFIIFMYYICELFRRSKDNEEQENIKIYSMSVSIMLITGGLLFLFFGGQLLVNQAVALAKLAGLSEMLIGLTIVAVGTSLPEFATSAIAAKRGHSDIAIGNIVGSNIFNIFWILGITSVIKPIPISAGANIDIIICFAATSVLFLAMFVGKKHTLEKWQGQILLASYAIYIIYLIKRG